MFKKTAAGLKTAGLVIGAVVFAFLLVKARFGLKACEELMRMHGAQNGWIVKINCTK